jgi:hypothetical protein
MKLKLTVLFAFFLAVSYAVPFFVIDTWPDEYCNSTIIARYVVNFPDPCLKRSVSQTLSPCERNDVGIHYTTDFSCCSSDVEPPFPDGWQIISFGGNSTCDFTGSNYGMF